VTLADIANAPPDFQAAALEVLRDASHRQLAALGRYWPFWARPDQTPPPDPWRTWLFLGGRGAGKTRAGAEWVRAEVEAGRRGRIALIAPALADVREVMIDGPSGLRSISSRGGAPEFEPSRRRLVWPNGAMAYGFSAEDPDSLRGPQFDGAWLDEFAAWPEAQAVYDMLQFALRIGADPRAMVTTTPRPAAPLKALLKTEGVVVTRAMTAANAANLSPGFVDWMRQRYQDTRLGRQELFGELLEDAEGALWTRDLIERSLDPDPPDLDRIVVAVDPPAGEGENADACGIVVAGAVGRDAARRAWVLADRTVRGASPNEWARRVAEAAQEFQADRVVVEVNQGGALVRTLLEIVDARLPVSDVWASRGKRARAEPVAAFYERGRVSHAARFPALEDQMCVFGSHEAGSQSPDRVDALVWALSALLLSGESEPRATLM
jgi:phage terminase large subunit-like protein